MSQTPPFTGRDGSATGSGPFDSGPPDRSRQPRTAPGRPVDDDSPDPAQAARGAELRGRMVSALCKGGGITSDAVRQAFLSVPREQFVPEIARRDGLEMVYRAEAALVIATDQRGVPVSSSSAPAIMAPMVEALDLRSGMRVLEIGAGTGYNAAILKRLVGTAGRVTSVDLDPQVARRARRALAQTGHRCRVVVGDGRRGWPLGSPFDRIVVTASSDSIPQAWWEQLVEGGLVELPLRLRKGAGVQAIVTLRREGVHLRSTSVTAGFFMPLRGPGRDDPPTSPASLRALSGADPPTVLASLEGEHLRSLSADAGRRALATLLGPGRRLRAIPAGTVVDLSMFLAWSEIPHLVWCHLDDRFGFGVIGDDGSSIASVTRRPGEHGWIEIRGSGEAQCLLLPHIERWEHLGCPTIDDLRVTVAFDAAPPVGSAAPSASVGRGITVTWTAVPPPAPPPVPTPGDQAAGPAPPSP